MSAADLVDYCFQSFDDLSLKHELLSGISAYGLRKPSKIHQHGVIPIIRGRDCILLAPPNIHRMTTLCIGVLQRVDISVSGLQAVILANTDADAQEFRGIIDVLCRGDPNVSQDTTVRLRPTHVLVGTEELIHNMIIQQTANSDDVKIYCVDDGEKVFSRHSNDIPLSPALQSIHGWLPKDVQVVVALSTISDDVVDVTMQVMSHGPMTIAVHEEEHDDDV